jgi:hypothetical protein
MLMQILAMVLGAVPFFKQLIFTTDAPFYFFTDSCNILGYAQLNLIQSRCLLFLVCVLHFRLEMLVVLKVLGY